MNLDSVIYGKIPPQAKEMEEAVLGAIMLESNALDIVIEFLKPEVFYVEAHQKVYSAMVDLASKSLPIDILTVVEELRSRGELEMVGGPYYVTRLTNNVVSSANIEAHARIVLQKFLQREMIRISMETLNECYDDQSDVFEIMDKAGSELFAINSGHLKKDFRPISEEYTKEFKLLVERITKDEKFTGVPSGFPSLDAITYGWQSTDLIIIAARPSVGKTAFSLNLARNAAYHPIKPTKSAVFSLEMSTGQLTARLMSSESRVRLASIKRGKMEQWELEKIKNLCDLTFLQDNIFIDDTPALGVFELRAKCRRLVNKHGVGLIIIDYLQLMSGDGGNREQEISKISRQLKALAKELCVPIIALSQLSRDVEKRNASGEPKLSDLRESGAIEQDADLVAFLYRLDYQQEAHKVDTNIAGVTYVKIAKHRNGALETIMIKAELSIQKFGDITEDQDTQAAESYVENHQSASTQEEMPF
ncbi:replicative DNA helicase [Chitinophaga sp. YR573]|nr:replicative DNA helicase [Chitinophaga sp. YR573]